MRRVFLLTSFLFLIVVSLFFIYAPSLGSWTLRETKGAWGKSLLLFFRDRGIHEAVNEISKRGCYSDSTVAYLEIIKSVPEGRELLRNRLLTETETTNVLNLLYADLMVNSDIKMVEPVILKIRPEKASFHGIPDRHFNFLLRQLKEDSPDLIIQGDGLDGHVNLEWRDKNSTSP